MNLLKTIFFATLIAMMILPFNAANIAEAEKSTNTIYDPSVVKYIKKIISQTGKTIEEKTIDGQIIRVSTKVNQIDDDTYKVRTIVKTDDVKIFSSYTKITVNDDGTYKIVNKRQGIEQTFTDVSQGATGTGSGNSDLAGARISLFDRETGTPHTLKLHDNYSACSFVNHAVFDATIRPNTVDVTWNGTPFYAHWCFIPHQFDHGKVQYGTTVHYFDGQNVRNGYHTFTNFDVGTTLYSVSVSFVYGTW